MTFRRVTALLAALLWSATALAQHTGGRLGVAFDVAAHVRPRAGFEGPPTTCASRDPAEYSRSHRTTARSPSR